MVKCSYCGFCEWFGCGNYSKASPQTTILPALIRKPNFSARDNSEVVRIEFIDRCMLIAAQGLLSADENPAAAGFDLQPLGKIHGNTLSLSDQ